MTGVPCWHRRCPMDVLMVQLFKSKKILKPDVPPPIGSVTRQELVIAGIGIVCVTALMAAVLVFAAR